MAGTPERLSIDDAHILALESSAIAGHTMKLILLEAGQEPLDLDALREMVDARLPEGSRGRERVEVGEGDASEARWALDESFDISEHVRRRPASAGIDEAEAWVIAGQIMSERLDHERPLWALDVIGPFEDGREAIVARIHHAMADGVSCVRFLSEILWEEESAEAARTAAAKAASAAGGAAVEKALRHPRAAELRRLPGAVRRELGRLASDSILDQHIGSARELAMTAVPLADLKAIGVSRPGHVTVNDVLLAGIAGGLREWLGGADHRLPHLKAQIPVSLHHRNESEHELGNRDSFLNVDLPLEEPDPVARLDLINAETAKRKELGDAEELYDLFHALSRFKHAGKVAERLASGPREFSLSISNVPGPRAPLSVAGRRVERLGSVAEPADRHALRISAISCSGTVGIGLCTDPEALAGVDELAVAIDGAFAELREACIG